MRRLYMVPYYMMMGTDGPPPAQPASGSWPPKQDIPALVDGWQGIYYAGSQQDYSEMGLIVTGFANDGNMELFHAIPEVAILPSLIVGASKPLAQHVGARGLQLHSGTSRLSLDLAGPGIRAERYGA